MQSMQKLNRFYPLFLYYSEKEGKKYRKIKKQKDKSIQPLNRLHVSALNNNNSIDFYKKTN